MSLPIIPGPNNGLITQSLAIPPQYPTFADSSSFASSAASASYVKHYWGTWYSTETQTASFTNTAYPIRVNTVGGTFDGFYISGSNGSTVSGSAIVIPKTGVYDFQFSLQIYNSGGGGAASSVNIWLVVNGSTVPYSNTQVSVNANSPYVVAAWDLMGSYNTGDKLELMWATNHTNNRIEALDSSSPAPATPSVIFTIMEL